MYNDNKCWESNLEISKDDKCPHITGDREPKVIIPLDIWQKIMALTDDVDTEWLGYLGGSHLQSGEWRVVTLTIPKQEVSTATCKSLESVHSEGVVHSHADMTCFFSNIDDDYLNSNHDFCIVVNKKADSKAVVRVKLPCGALSIVEADVIIEYPEVKDAAKFIDDAKKNIAEEPGWQHTNKSNTLETGVPDYIPSKERLKQLKPWDYAREYNEDMGY